MTLGGASESCIQVGYTKPEYGFFALYRDGQLCAQSFLYTNPRTNPEVIVCDNIEANQGRDKAVILEKYKSFFTLYLTQELEKDLHCSFETVNIGTGYTDIGLASLPPTKSVLIPDNDVYTDANIQKRLLTIDTDKINELKKMATSKKQKAKIRRSGKMTEAPGIEHVENLEPILENCSYEKAATIAELEQAIYPASLQQGEQFFIEEMTAGEPQDNHSFILSDQVESNVIPVGYGICYSTESEFDYGDTVLFVSDLALLPEFQRKGFGRKMFFKIITLAKERGLPIEFQARASTSYLALKHAESEIRSLGYEITKDELEENYFSEGDEITEDVHFVRLELIADNK